MRAPILLLALTVAACGSEPSPEEKAASDAAASAEMSAGSRPPEVAPREGGPSSHLSGGFRNAVCEGLADHIAADSDGDRREDLANSCGYESHWAMPERLSRRAEQWEEDVIARAIDPEEHSDAHCELAGQPRPSWCL